MAESGAMIRAVAVSTVLIDSTSGDLRAEYTESQLFGQRAIWESGCRVAEWPGCRRQLNKPGNLATWQPASQRPHLDPEPIHARLDDVAGMDLRIAGGHRIEERTVAAAEVADADGAFGIGDDLEVAAGEVLVGDADVALAADD